MKHPFTLLHVLSSRARGALALAAPMALAALVTVSPNAFAQLTELASKPLASTSSADVKPNIMYILDNSGSMGWLSMPDEMESYTSRIGYKNHLCNTIYYNPAVNYTEPKKADGSNFDTASFTAAYPNGYSNYPNSPSSGAVNLSSGFRAHTGESTQAAYYYVYTGTQTLTPATGACINSDPNSNSTYNTNIAASGGGNWQKRQVTATSGPGATDERTNFANWYQYYRSRMMMMKATTSRAFNQLNDSYRIGYITINPGSPVTTAQYVPIDDFNASQRDTWFTKLFGQTASGGTPLRQALARVGRHYAGKTDQINTGMTGDPVQYSCQQNFALLTTDGYWNGAAGVALDGTSAVGNTDGNILVTPRPMWDGTATMENVTNKSNTYFPSESCTTGIQQRQQQTQRRDVQHQRRTVQNRQRTEQIQQRTIQNRQRVVQVQRRTVTNLRATSSTTNATVNIIVQTVNNPTTLNAVNINGVNRLSGTYTENNGNAANRRAGIVNYIANNLTGGFITTSGACSGNNNPVQGCANNRNYVRIMMPPGSGTTFTSVSVGTSSGSIASSNSISNTGATTTVSTTGPSASATCTAGTAGSLTNNTLTTTTCSTSDTGFVNIDTCTASSGGGVTVTCQNFSDTGFQNVGTCTPSNPVGTGPTTTCQVFSDSNWVNASSCSPSNPPTGPTVSCQTTDTGFVNVGTCTPGVSGGQTVTCQVFSDTGFANSNACTESNPASGPTVTCQTTSDTGWIDGTCSASNPANGPTRTCQVLDSDWFNVASCSSSNVGGLNTTCRTGRSGLRIRYRTTTSVTSTNLATGAVSTSTPSTSSFQNWDGICYAGGVGLQTPPSPGVTPPIVAMPTPPANGTPAAGEDPLPTAPCTAWPCTTITTSGGSFNSLSDVAQYYYNTDLRPGMPDNVPAGGSGVEDDKATWQHMTTMTIGMGLAGTLAYKSDYKTAATGDFQDIRDGSKIWPIPSADSPSSLDDLWHTAVNGRGQFFSASDPDSLVTSLSSALSGVNARVASAAAAATSNLEPVAGDNFAYTAKYRTVDWTGELEAHEIDLSTGEVKAAVIWSAQSALNAKVGNQCDNRNIYLFRSGVVNNRVSFTWNTQGCNVAMNPNGVYSTGLNAAEQAHFGAAQVAALSHYPSMTDGTGSPATDNQRAAAAGEKLVNYVRGQRGYEGFVPNDASKLYRSRAAVLGDIVNAQPVYVKAPFASYTDAGYSTFKTANINRTPMVYVAANDGMLHAFYAGTSTIDPDGGKEAWAFIPTMVLPNLYKLADNNYSNNHVYSVDGTPSVGDFYDTNASAWKTILVGGLNAGGKGYYALDVTDPASPKGLWEFKWSDTCYDSAVPSTAYSDCHIGFTFNNPLISKLADGTWVVMVTSGYNNVNSPIKTGDGLGYLYVLRAYDGKILYKIATSAGTSAQPSGLNHIANWVDTTIVNNTTLRVYGGDVLGNMWRFDVNDTIGAAGREATLIGTAKTSGGTPTAQPITTRPELALNGSSPFVMFGTGKMLGTGDLIDSQKQSIYGVVDPLTAGTSYPDLRGSLKPLTMTQVGSGLSATRTIACGGSTAECNIANGWVVDLPDNGERVNVDMKLQLGTLVVASNVPENSACTIGGYSWLNYVNYSTGMAVANSTGGAVSQKLSDSLAVGLNIVRLPDGRTVVITTTSDAKQTTIGAPFDTPSPTGKRISWREISQ